ncbi:hypothetical protein [Allopontixanthobacter sp.]|uniref:hypothetical protein n=1 Tax=Allopontixanthobacter sp. TaxID=2906452 RepID=UPI002ABCB559|nr:hypothetical protein [Allopontixanthobacter sp.]MDZ4307486.1 hypothetical protein [Allopontixanthobacter sp.]
MPPKSRIETPAGYATSVAVGYSDNAGDLALVTAITPLPVSVTAATPPPPMAGTASASGLVGPFATAAGMPIHLQTGGTWEGRVSLLRSVDGGATTSGLTAAGMRWASFTVNVNEVVWQDSDPAATFYLAITLASGAVSYRVSQ